MIHRMVPLVELAATKPYALVGGPFGSKLTSADYVNEGIPVIRGTNLTAGRYLSERDFVFVTEEKLRADLFGNMAHPGDIVFTQRGTLGQVSIIPENSRFQEYVISQSQMKLSVDSEKADARFIYYWFSSRETVEKVISQNSSSGVPHINLTALRNFKVPVPALLYQRKIADTLSSYDDLITNNLQRIALLEKAARMLYREWFVYFRFPGHEHIEISNGLPKQWNRRLIGDMCTFLGRGISPSYDDEAEYTVVNQKCVRDRMLSMGPARRQKKEFKKEKELRHLDVLINSTGTGTLGRVAQCWFEPSRTTFDSHVTVARSNETVDPYWFGYALLELESLFEDMGEGATNQKELGRARISATSVVEPPKLLQKSFGSFTADSTRQIQALMEQNKKLAQARDLLLPRLMNGEIAV